MFNNNTIDNTLQIQVYYSILTISTSEFLISNIIISINCIFQSFSIPSMSLNLLSFLSISNSHLFIHHYSLCRFIFPSFPKSIIPVNIPYVNCPITFSHPLSHWFIFLTYLKHLPRANPLSNSSVPSFDWFPSKFLLFPWFLFRENFWVSFIHFSPLFIDP